MRISKFVLLFFFCLSFNLQASGSLNIEEVTTRKGFKFLFVENCALPKVSLNISFKDAGYVYESAEKQGLAWFTSLVIQEGAGENDAKDFAKKLKIKGINLLFYPDLESFGVSLETLSENLEESISLLSDAIIRPKVDSEGLNRVFEKAKVDFNNLEKNPYFVAGKELDTLLFKKHPYSKSVYGTLDTIMSITRDDVLTYIKRNFAKDNIVISVAGCTKKEEIITLLDKYLSKLPSKRSKVRKIPVKNDFGSAESKNIFMDIPQSVILFAQKGIAYEDPDYYNAQVLVNALGGMGLNSVLMKELRQNLGITYGISASMASYTHANIIAGGLSTDSSTASQSISAIRDTLSRIKKEGIDEQLFKDTKISMVNNFIFSLSNNANTAVFLASMQVRNRDINRLNNFVSLINDVKLEKVNELASSLLEPENLFFVEVGKNAQGQ
ncbi:MULTISPECIES: M16 family metallopeptidase [Wolbachia]|nr:MULTISPECIES: pitrilysin family protein [Wolbachia]MDX5488044.1 pitrilysin family protein [Wolbachia endosymbiont of Andrena praecox]MDX5498005.1 pitrilysin family protein [Wolbachia endosymbiont of Lasioglossum nitidulum]MDX5543459.1 pitrilysin family protein [Wolbachia endosymbiont of Andrena apicata]MDX5561441.1 pitrilysin family protein [Wolbachia endosymbiont of Andrena bicolor]MDX5596273.1 pitrilysin family protein [Wolbachia endosymbiont of Andrena labialis]